MWNNSKKFSTLIPPTYALGEKSIKSRTRFIRVLRCRPATDTALRTCVSLLIFDSESTGTLSHRYKERSSYENIQFLSNTTFVEIDNFRIVLFRNFVRKYIYIYRCRIIFFNF